MHWDTTELPLCLQQTRALTASRSAPLVQVQVSAPAVLPLIPVLRPQGDADAIMDTMVPHLSLPQVRARFAMRSAVPARRPALARHARPIMQVLWPLKAVAVT